MFTTKTYSPMSEEHKLKQSKETEKAMSRIFYRFIKFAFRDIYDLYRGFLRLFLAGWIVQWVVCSSIRIIVDFDECYRAPNQSWVQILRIIFNSLFDLLLFFANFDVENHFISFLLFMGAIDKENTRTSFDDFFNLHRFAIIFTDF